VVEVIWVLDSVFELTHKQLVTAVDLLLNHRDLVLQAPDVVTNKQSKLAAPGGLLQRRASVRSGFAG
jgi:hypothetical protein